MRRSLYLALGAALCVTPLAFAMSQAAPAATPYKAPRNAFGQPDLQGYWTNATITGETRPAKFGDRLVLTPDEVRELEGAVQTEVKAGNRSTDPNAPPPTVGGDPLPEGIRPQFAGAAAITGGYDRGWLDPGAAVMRVHGEPRTSFLTTPDGRPPKPLHPVPRPTRLQRNDGDENSIYAGVNDNPEDRSLGERCIISFGRNAGPPMLPNGFYNNNYQIVQGKDDIVINIEMVHDVRVVRLNGKHRTDGVRPWFGDSIGWWDGDTLVVETTNLPEALAYNGSWQNLKVTERFTRDAPDRLLYQYTIEDPTMWDQPWGGEYEFAALNGRLYEYACHEGNYALEGMLAGARAEDADRAAAAADKSASR